MTTRTTMLSLAVGSAIAVAGLVGGGISLAMNDNSPHGSTSSVGTNQTTQSDDWIKALATKLGKTEQELRDAIKQTNLDFLDKAVADGKLTKDQADKIRQRIESSNGSGPFGFGIGRHGAGPNGMGPGKGGVFGFGPLMQAGDDFAKFLGMNSAADLRTEMQSGKSLSDIASAHGKSRDDLKKYITDTANKLASDAVSSGKLTQAQADAMKQQLANNLDKIIDMKPGSQGGPHMRGGQPGFGPMGRFQQTPNGNTQ